MKRLKFRYLFAVYAVVLSCVCMFWIYPAHDDWGYAAPKPGVNILERLMPRKAFWRPFDRLIEYGLGYAPSLWPGFNHVFRLAGHFLLCLFLYAVLKKLTDNKKYSAIGTFFLCLSPSILTTVTNSDYINQVWAMLSGLTSAFFFFKAYKSRKSLYYVLWMLFAFVSVFWKENGIVWFIAPVMLNVTYLFTKGESLASSARRNFVYILAGLAGMLLYFSARFYLIGGVSLGSADGGKGRYLLNFSVLHIIRNYSLIIGGAVTSIDSLALFMKPRNIPIIIITGVTSVIFLCFILARIYDIFRNKRRLFWGLVMLFVCAGYISSSYAIVGHNNESTSYEMIFMSGLILGIILSSSRPPKWSNAIIAAMFACMLLSSCHKLYVMHNYTLGVRNFLAEHAGDFRNTPDKAYVYFIDDIPEDGFAVYTYPAGHGLNYGGAFNSLWGWKAAIKIECVSSDADIKFTSDSLPEYDTVFSLTQSGKIKVLRN